MNKELVIGIIQREEDIGFTYKGNFDVESLDGKIVILGMINLLRLQLERSMQDGVHKKER